MALAASSWKDVWAFGSGNRGRGGYALRWDGRRWRIMKRWSGLTSAAGAVVRGPADIWLFSRVSGTVRHYNVHTWQRESVLAGAFGFESVTSLPNGDIWAIPDATTPLIVHGTASKAGGYSWSSTDLTGYPDPGTGSPPLTNLYARSRTDVWAAGGGVHTVSGRVRWFPLLAHWNGHTWLRVKVSARFALGECNPVSDGRGGLWLTTSWDSTGVPPHLVHFTGGKLVRVSLPRQGSRYVGVISLANIPASRSVWGVGAITGLGALGPSTGVILKHGR